MILLAMLLTACGKTNVSDAGGEGIIFDQEDRLPAMIAKDADSYYVLTNQHDDTHYKLMTGNDLHQLVEQYHTDGVTIRHLYASDGYAGWVEEDEKEYRYNVYDSRTNQVKTVWRAASPERSGVSQNIQMGMYKNSLYYSQNDFEINKVRLVCYDMKSGASTVIHKAALRADRLGNYGITALDVREKGILTAYVNTDHNRSRLLRTDLNTGKSHSVKIPGAVDAVYAVSYDDATGMSALYYEGAKTIEEQVGIFKEKSKEIKVLYTFGHSGWALDYEIRLHQGHLYWANELNTLSGTADPDHHWVVDYDCNSDQYKEYKHAFRSTIIEGRLCLLAFENGMNTVRIQIL